MENNKSKLDNAKTSHYHVDGTANQRPLFQPNTGSTKE